MRATGAQGRTTHSGQASSRQRTALRCFLERPRWRDSSLPSAVSFTAIQRNPSIFFPLGSRRSDKPGRSSPAGIRRAVYQMNHLTHGRLDRCVIKHARRCANIACDLLTYRRARALGRDS
jgi:hypothetical protein